MGTIGKFLFLQAIASVKLVAAAYVFMLMWGWFVVSKFPGAPAITHATACGVLLVAQWLQLDTHLQNTFAESKTELQAKLKTPIGDFGWAIEKLVLTIFMVIPLTLGIIYAWHLVLK